MPALLMRMSIGPISLSQWRTASPTLSGLVTSKAIAVTSAPVSARSAAAAPSATSSRALSTIFAPASESALAMPKPSPRLDPVTKARRPVRSNGERLSMVCSPPVDLHSQWLPPMASRVMIFHTRGYHWSKIATSDLSSLRALWSLSRPRAMHPAHGPVTKTSEGLFDGNGGYRADRPGGDGFEPGAQHRGKRLYDSGAQPLARSR